MHWIRKLIGTYQMAEYEEKIGVDIMMRFRDDESKTGSINWLNCLIWCSGGEWYPACWQYWCNSHNNNPLLSSRLMSGAGRVGPGVFRPDNPPRGCWSRAVLLTVRNHTNYRSLDCQSEPSPGHSLLRSEGWGLPLTSQQIYCNEMGRVQGLTGQVPSWETYGTEWL